MKKQFFRVKQLADQTFLRAGKSEQLSYELQEADHKVEYIKNMLTAISKRIPAAQAATGSLAEVVEKKMKKTPEYQLGMTMLEHGPRKDEQDEGLLRPMMGKCGMAELELGRIWAEHEKNVETMVGSNVQQVLDTEVPNILKHKRNLSKLILDKDSANNRLQAASKHGNKNEALRDEMEEAEQKVEQFRDVLAAEMFSLLRRESEVAQWMLQLLKLQRGYHESSLHVLSELIPELEREIGNSQAKAMFGCALSEHLRLHRRQIALPLEVCVCALWELGMEEEGLFRVAGGASRVRRLKLSLDSGCFSYPLPFEYRDAHVLASALKSYLRELPEPLLTFDLHDEWLRAARLPEEARLEAISSAIAKLPPTNRDNLKYLVQFLAALSRRARTRMTPSNIAIVMAPNLLWAHRDDDMASAAAVNGIVDALVSHVDRFFPDEFCPYQTLKKEDLFPDLAEFDRPPVAATLHSVNNSNNGEGSPRPVARRKNKPAPTPPPLAYTSGSSTVNRVTYRQAKENGAATEDGARRKSLELEPPRTRLTKSDISPPVMNEERPNGPVPAPRPSLANTNPPSDEDIRLRHPVPAPKPAVPERPASLRPASFRAELERTHVYSVADRQQVSIVQVQGRSGHDSRLADKERFLSNEDNSRPDRPPKPDFIKSLERISISSEGGSTARGTTHARTMSDGDIVDSSSSQESPPSPLRGRPPPVRPQPPPPPPPAQLARPLEDNSTDL